MKILVVVALVGLGIILNGIAVVMTILQQREQQRQVSQLGYTVSLLIGQHLPEDKEYAEFGCKWAPKPYYTLSSGYYEPAFVDFERHEIYAIYYASGYKGRGAQIEFIRVTNIPDSNMTEWTNRPCFHVEER